MQDKVFIAIPSGKSAPDVDMTVSLTNTMFYLYEHGMRPERQFIHGNCYVHLCRTLLTHQFMKTDCSHLFFWDDDVSAPPPALARLFNFDRDIICAQYPKKVQPGLPPGDTWPVVLTDGIPDAQGLLECEMIATGFMLIRRNVIETLYKLYANSRSFWHKPFNEEVIDLFPTGIIDGFPMNALGHRMWWGEDYAFSVLAKRAGFKLWTDPTVPLAHAGRNVWRGDFTKAADDAEPVAHSSAA